VLAAGLAVAQVALGGPGLWARTLWTAAARVLGPDHTTTLVAAAGLTDALVQSGEAEPARALGEDTLPRCRRVLGPRHPITLYVAQVADIP